MKYRKLDENGDMIFGNGSADFYIDNPQSVAQACLTRLRLWAGEWFIDLAEGTPYPDGILGKWSKASSDPIIQQRILETEGVVEIVEYDSYVDPDKRFFYVQARIETAYGEAQLSANLQ